MKEKKEYRVNLLMFVFVVFSFFFRIMMQKMLVFAFLLMMNIIFVHWRKQENENRVFDYSFFICCSVHDELI